MATVCVDEPASTKWTTELKVYCVKRYIETKSYKAVIADFVTRFPNHKSPYKCLIWKWVCKFEDSGTVENLNRKTPGRVTHSGRKRIRSDEMIMQVRESVEESPHRSSRRRSQELGISRSTLLRILKADIDLFPYHITMHQKLTDHDRRVRVDMCKVLCEKIESSAAKMSVPSQTFLSLLWTSDEAHFYLNGQVNSKNNIYWGSERPDEVASKPLHSKKVTVWCALSSRGIIGPFFFEEKGKTTTINSERYMKVLEKFWKELTTQFPSVVGRMWFQQDGATPHCSEVSLDWLKAHFKSRVVSRRTPIGWPPYSPDLSPPDFFLWGHLKNRVYRKTPKTLPALKRAITEEIRAIPADMLKRVMQNFALRLKHVMDRKGAHIEHQL